MSTTVGLLNLVLGTVYTSYGLLTVMDMWRGRRTRGFSHFGMAWILMAFTCGPHHLHHAGHILFQGRDGAALDLFAVVVGFPAGVVWFLLRVEAIMGGPGDRTVSGTPAWIESLPTLSGMYAAAFAGVALGLGSEVVSYDAIITPNVALVVLYFAIGGVLLRTQLDNYRATGNWSLSGLSLTLVFPTCALMHGAYALYASTGRYDADLHSFGIDILSIPAAAYFLWVVWSLAHDRLHDWNRGARDSQPHPDRYLEAPLDVRTTT